MGFIGGGNMAEALVRGLLHSKVKVPDDIWVSDVKPERLAHLEADHGVHTTVDNHALVRACGVVVVSVKPQVVDKVLAAIAPDVGPETLIVSVAAGVPIAAIEARLPGARVVRTMPNTPATALAGATAVAAGTLSTDDDVATARALFEAVGR
ncbi:MAG TPA: NAD(P)-binding domain-containing protein, partial [Polyangiaceae bacterium]|nr:NAD(P)-binding domain-containing protein [Polyangiaceae bacterium]